MIQQRNIALCIVLSIVTCGLYGLYWYVCLTNDTNAAAGTEGPSGGVTLLLTIITCNIYSLYWGYKQGEKIDIIKQKHGQPSSNSNILYLILCFLIPVVAWALMQNELNNVATSNNYSLRSMVRKRLFQVLRSGLFLLLIGGIYSIFLQKTGIGFVCPVNFLTGLKCPGCGVSHMCIALMQLDFAAAFMANPAILLLSPVLAAVLLQYFMHYIKTGRWQIRPAQNVILWICIMILIFYGIGRNLFPRLCTIE